MTIPEPVEQAPDRASDARLEADTAGFDELDLRQLLPWDGASVLPPAAEGGFALFEVDRSDGVPGLRLVRGNGAARAAFNLAPGERLGPCPAARPSARIWLHLWQAIDLQDPDVPRLLPRDREPKGQWDVRVAPAGPGRAVVTWRDGDELTGPDHAVGAGSASGVGLGERAVTHDLITGLPNAALFRGRLADALAGCGPKHRVALVLCTLNGLADAARLRYGAAVSDGILRVSADRLSRRLRRGDLVARIGGDTFALVLRWPAADVDPARLLRRFTESLGRPFVVRATLFAPVPSMGLVLADSTADSTAHSTADQQGGADGLVLRAFELMQRSKIAGEPLVDEEAPADAEDARIAALTSYEIHDRGLDGIFESAARLAAAACEAPYALISFLDGDLEWVRSCAGLEAHLRPGARGPRHLALCDTTIRGRSVQVFRDLRRDLRCHSKHVCWQRDMAFYAGAPLVDREGRAIGALSVLDVVPRDLSARQRQALANLADDVMGILEARRQERR